MMQRTAYSFSILRYIHDITSGEFINVGIAITANDRSYIRAKINTNYGRAKKIFPNLNAEGYRKRLRSIQSIVDAVSIENQGSLEFSSENPIQEVLRHTLATDDSSLQWSSIRSGLSRNLEETLNEIYARYVVKFEKTSSENKVKDEDVWKEFRSELEKRHLLRFLTPTTIESIDDSVHFDHAWKNGIWHCLEPISFDLSSAASIREKAHKWLGQISSVSDGAKEEFSVYFLTGKPIERDLHEAYEQAIKILQKCDNASVIQQNEASKLSKDLEKKIKIHFSKNQNTEI